MVLTGRTALIALAAVLPIAVSSRPATVFLLCAVALVAAVAADVALAGSPSGIQLSRSGAASARLGQTVDTVLQVRNAGRRRLRGLLRDAWPPSAAAQPRDHRLDLESGASATVTTRLRPLRRGGQR
ncbi:MAG: DUF11 domain-containing protein, partial [Mycobacterium sp.]|nr:DUF11 domain-containing protein [Mycobacterium sp.]